ncbi:hypothetical protein IFM89_028306 [Coptis chinensis]|uniref:Response regulatory domain-containing protein n=1 Tax=Coptis chinensis TaxID=261450 RepID=A0A835I4R7_9MAGN|nr:hypothetical protein IFM89_028306 [Coptis chinensis]
MTCNLRSTWTHYENLILFDNQLQETKVNLIMTDYSMPGMTGYDLLQRVKKSSWKDVPVVVMSSENVPSRMNMCLEGGAKEFLLKPVQLSDLRKLRPHLLESLESSCNDGGKTMMVAKTEVTTMSQTESANLHEYCCRN